MGPEFETLGDELRAMLDSDRLWVMARKLQRLCQPTLGVARAKTGRRPMRGMIC